MSKLGQAVHETKEWLQINGNPEANDSDAIDFLSGECGQMPDGSCSQAGTEYCDFECPFSG